MINLFAKSWSNLTGILSFSSPSQFHMTRSWATPIILFSAVTIQGEEISILGPPVGLYLRHIPSSDHLVGVEATVPEDETATPWLQDNYVSGRPQS